ANVVDFLQRCFSGLRLSQNVEVRVFGIGKKKLFPGLMVFPSHASWLLQPKRTALTAGGTWTFVDLAESALQARQAVIVLIHSSGYRAGTFRLTGECCRQ